MKSIKFLKLAFYLIIGVLVFLKAISFIDPDFGWHLATGNIILQSGFPKTDPFSYTMPSFPFVEHEWLVDIIFAKLYPVAGLPGISILCSLLFLSAIWVSVSKLKEFKPAFFIVGISSLASFFTNSPKVFSWLLFSLFILAVFNEKFWEKYWFAIPLIILLWTNLHGSFPEALIILLVIFICKSIREKRVWIKGLTAVFLSFLATLINPYGVKLWWIIWLTVSDPLIKYRIAEWQPAYANLLGFSFLTLFLFTISAVLIFRYWRRFKIEQIVLNLIFFVQAILAVRNITIWVLLDLPMLATAINYFLSDPRVKKTGKVKLEIVSKGMLLLVGIIFVFQCISFAFRYSNLLKENLFYPKGAVSYLELNLPGGQIFSEYNWGGYLIWELPEKKVFVYGMMPSWTWRSGPLSESNNAMTDYFDTIAGKIPYQTVFNKYNIDTALLSVPKEQKPITTFAEKITHFFGIKETTNTTDPLYKELEKDGWKEAYKKNSMVVLKKP